MSGRGARERIDAVLFDFDHTLGVDNRLEERVLRELTQRYCSAPPSDARIASALARFRSGQIDLAVMLSEAFEGCGCGSAIVSEYKSAVLRLLPSLLEPKPGAIKTLNALRSRGRVVAILSNGWTELQLAKAAGIGFDGPVIVSEAIGAWKPDRSAFEIAADQLGIALARSMYVGDSPVADVAGSKNAGMIGCWADLEGQRYPDGVVKPDRTITRLEELIEALEPK